MSPKKLTFAADILNSSTTRQTRSQSKALLAISTTNELETSRLLKVENPENDTKLHSEEPVTPNILVDRREEFEDAEAVFNIDAELKEAYERLVEAKAQVLRDEERVKMTRQDINNEEKVQMRMDMEIDDTRQEISILQTKMANASMEVSQAMKRLQNAGETLEMMWRIFAESAAQVEQVEQNLATAMTELKKSSSTPKEHDVISASLGDLQTVLNSAKMKHIHDKEQLEGAKAALECCRVEYDNCQAVFLGLERALEKKQSLKMACVDKYLQTCDILKSCRTKLEICESTLSDSLKMVARCRAECSEREILLKNSRTQTILTHGFPHPTCSSQTTATDHTQSSRSHIDADLKKSRFAAETALSLKSCTHGTLWHAYKAFGDYTNEMTLSWYIKATVKELMSAFPQFDDMQVSELVTFKSSLDDVAFGCNSDMWVIRLFEGTIPYCAIEVKLPTANIHETKLPSTVYGQMFDYLLLLRKNFGIRAPFGFITTYFTWWICWLPDCDVVAQASSVDTFSPCPDIEKTRELHTKILHLPVSNEESVITSKQKKKVQDFCLQIGSAILKSINCGVGDAVTSLPSKLACYSEDNITWDSLDPQTTKIIDRMPSKRTEKFFRLNFLGKGADGDVRSVCNASGHRCAVKFSKRKCPEDALTQEETFWTSINCVKAVFLTTLDKRPALIMPYLHPLSKDERESPNIQELVIKLLESCADHGYMQTDAAWRHVGWYRYEKTHKLMLFDFGHMAKFADRQQAINNAVRAFCVCAKRGECTMCVYVQNHETNPE